MVQTLAAKNLNLYDLEEKFNLQLNDDENFFPESRENLPELNDLEKQTLDEVRENFRHLSKYPPLEAIVKLVVLSPLLRLAGFYRPPFYLVAEKEVKLDIEEEDTKITGRLDFLVFTPKFSVLAVETKGAKASLYDGITQALTYMLADANSQEPSYGFVTNGLEFLFLKLVNTSPPQYGESNGYLLRNPNDIYLVLRILKRFANLVQQRAGKAIANGNV
ncbi:restriction endonuclease subunit R [Spirulina sp. 06S082]|uniref:restriction endonuclease subunit R n=1 Tax=Spirulina sp. 06S082 TaxID=3110248 RepID=UPI002B20EFF2|nr:restriction endonuclease subunit R [Spirulina sp. 06S082]MEA5467465.1 restriction endonuclease subunit R [Spirulina sp. 06S082]